MSAKFRADGTALTSRYHVALQPPCECWGLDPEDVLVAAEASAKALEAPPLVFTWIEVLRTVAETSGTLPLSLGFGLSKEDNVAKLYVLNAAGSEMPSFPLLPTPDSLSVDTVLPPLATSSDIQRSMQPHMLSMEW